MKKAFTILNNKPRNQRDRRRNINSYFMPNPSLMTGCKEAVANVTARSCRAPLEREKSLPSYLSEFRGSGPG